MKLTRCCHEACGTVYSWDPVSALGESKGSCLALQTTERRSIYMIPESAINSGIQFLDQSEHTDILLDFCVRVESVPNIGFASGTGCALALEFCSETRHRVSWLSQEKKHRAWEFARCFRVAARLPAPSGELYMESIGGLDIDNKLL